MSPLLATLASSALFGVTAGLTAAGVTAFVGRHRVSERRRMELRLEAAERTLGGRITAISQHLDENIKLLRLEDSGLVEMMAGLEERVSNFERRVQQSVGQFSDDYKILLKKTDGMAAAIDGLSQNQDADRDLNKNRTEDDQARFEAIEAELGKLFARSQEHVSSLIARLEPLEAARVDQPALAAQVKELLAPEIEQLFLMIKDAGETATAASMEQQSAATQLLEALGSLEKRITLVAQAHNALVSMIEQPAPAPITYPEPDMISSAAPAPRLAQPERVVPRETPQLDPGMQSFDQALQALALGLNNGAGR